MTKPRWAPTAQAALDRIQSKLFATTTEAAAVLDYDARTVRKGIEAAEIPSISVGNTYRIPVRWLLDQVGIVPESADPPKGDGADAAA
jgi:excisionase family DNA binding protein